MYKILINKEVKDCFPNVEIVLRIYLVFMTTNSSSERSFSNLKHIKIDCVLLWTETVSIN